MVYPTGKIVFHIFHIHVFIFDEQLTVLITEASALFPKRINIWKYCIEDGDPVSHAMWWEHLAVAVSKKLREQKILRSINLTFASAKAGVNSALKRWNVLKLEKYEKGAEKSLSFLELLQKVEYTAEESKFCKLMEQYNKCEQVGKYLKTQRFGRTVSEERDLKVFSFFHNKQT